MGKCPELPSSLLRKHNFTSSFGAHASKNRAPHGTGSTAAAAGSGVRQDLDPTEAQGEDLTVQPSADNFNIFTK